MQKAADEKTKRDEFASFRFGALDEKDECVFRHSSFRPAMVFGSPGESEVFNTKAGAR